MRFAERPPPTAPNPATPDDDHRRAGDHTPVNILVQRAGGERAWMWGRRLEAEPAEVLRQHSVRLHTSPCASDCLRHVNFLMRIQLTVAQQFAIGERIVPWTIFPRSIAAPTQPLTDALA
jgi:hypothetical protein